MLVVVSLHISRRAASKTFCCRNCKVVLISLLIGLLVAGIALGTIITIWLNPIDKIYQHLSHMSIV